jgi:transcriptional antiterminator RfaH
MNGSSSLQQAAWHVVHTKPKQEFRALRQLENQGYECYLAILRRETVWRGKRKTCVEPLFARYLFVRLNGISRNWSAISSTRGVSSLLKFGDRFATLPGACIEALQSAPQIMRRNFEPGERVIVTSGPFAGLEGIYQAPDSEVRAHILIEIMNQPQRLLLATEALRKAT